MAIISLVVALFIIIADQLIKLVVLNNLVVKGSVNLITWFDKEILNLTYCENTGAAFSIFKNNTTMLSIVTSLFLAALIFYLFKTKSKSKFMFICLAMIIGGGAGNVIDRFYRGFVIDYIDFRIINFAIFNFADICIVVGIILLMVYILFIEGKEMKKPKKTEEPIESSNDVNE